MSNHVIDNEHRIAQENFEGEAKKKFNLKQFRKTSIRKVYDSLHGISNEAVRLSDAVEMMAYCLIDGKLEQESVFETNLYNDLVEQLKGMKDGFTYLNFSSSKLTRNHNNLGGFSN